MLRAFPQASSFYIVAKDAIMAAAETVAMETRTLVTRGHDDDIIGQCVTTLRDALITPSTDTDLPSFTALQ